MKPSPTEEQRNQFLELIDKGVAWKQACKAVGMSQMQAKQLAETDMDAYKRMHEHLRQRAKSRHWMQSMEYMQKKIVDDSTDEKGRPTIRLKDKVAIFREVGEQLGERQKAPLVQQNFDLSGLSDRLVMEIAQRKKLP